MKIRCWDIAEMRHFLETHGCKMISDQYFDEGRLLFLKDGLIIPLQVMPGRPFFPSHIVFVCNALDIPVPQEFQHLHDQLQFLFNRPGGVHGMPKPEVGTTEEE